ncbi:hypothetical protein [Streptomyces sp. NPDC087300]|uniref:hypothetical protein n=1 Tax=Streptomyces sp. NPDC087300 TaxID=3365780 RepID=UPI0037FADFB6
MPNSQPDPLLHMEGNVTTVRVKEGPRGRGSVELSFFAAGKLGGVDVEAAFTYDAEVISSRVFVGTGSILVRSDDGTSTAFIRARGAALRGFNDLKMEWRASGALESDSDVFAAWNRLPLEFTVWVEFNREVTVHGALWTTPSPRPIRVTEAERAPAETNPDFRRPSALG